MQSADRIGSVRRVQNFWIGTLVIQGATLGSLPHPSLYK